jgi:Fe-S-cluster containining protein
MPTPQHPSLAAFLARHHPDGDYLPAIEDIYRQMDAAYDETARAYGFHCHGCEDNCCRTRFYHHTLAEIGYLLEGFRRLAPEAAAGMVQRARQVVADMARADDIGSERKRMCPVNVNGRCLLYAHRPMICRMHGLPSIMTRPDGASHCGPGCDDFHREHGAEAALRLDRTPHYRRMAELEQHLRRTSGWHERIKLTVADLICTFDAALAPGEGHT